MVYHSPTPQTLLIVGFFSILYMIFLSTKLYRGHIDLYDFIMLSMLALIPALFVFWPALAAWIGRLSGVLFPFVVMFSALFLVVFVFVHRLTVKLHQSENSLRSIIQELSLLKHEINRDRSKNKNQ